MYTVLLKQACTATLYCLYCLTADDKGKGDDLLCPLEKSLLLFLLECSGTHMHWRCVLLLWNCTACTASCRLFEQVLEFNGSRQNIAFYLLCPVQYPLLLFSWNAGAHKVFS
jgi:hypothetical protein